MEEKSKKERNCVKKEIIIQYSKLRKKAGFGETIDLINYQLLSKSITCRQNNLHSSFW